MLVNVARHKGDSVLDTHSVALFLALVTLLISARFGLIRFTLLGVESLPALSEHLADLSYIAS